MEKPTTDPAMGIERKPLLISRGTSAEQVKMHAVKEAAAFRTINAS